MICNWGSLFYSPPEVYLGLEFAGPEVDIWSLGVVLYAMVTGKLPFEGTDNTEIVSNILSGTFNIPDYCSKNLVSLLKSLIQIDVNKRLSIKEIRNHPWIKLERHRSRRGSVILSCVAADTIEHTPVTTVATVTPITSVTDSRKKSLVGLLFAKFISKSKTVKLHSI